ncbi:MAG: virulence RhuM family protein [Vampirovibrio sp.]|nr:virulence RhuM family protein [Vampirovibrio sp.]
MNAEQHPIIMYQTEDGVTKIEVKLEEQTVWLNQAQLVELFQSSKSNISEHIKTIFEDGELSELATVRNFRTVQKEGERTVSRDITHYNLDMIIAVGYRVKSTRATQFRIWATQVLKEYIVKGFSLNDDLLKNVGGGLYWEELLERIRDIRSTETVFYKAILKVFATSLDYDPNTDESVRFFKMVQNKMHFAAHGKTAAEIIYERADSSKPFMGLTTFKGKKQPAKSDVTVAKNYLSQDELSILNRISTAYSEFAELQALRKTPMYMKDWIKKLDDFIQLSGSELLTHAGKISAAIAESKAFSEYQTYKALPVEALSPVEQHFLDTLKKTQQELEAKPKKRPKQGEQ